ncbi:phosphoribosylformylglycinamidine synthase subunit PurS [Methylacidiphilum caldifontis]|uniref:Phosphoribosylformylglycinamidine synthase subunit PurS n=1 Tax=Methylacidiphilum caldifontis TaxID=2795386 RepID=A0A4Y8PCP4_9BACT|nr:phosphoribosylformylglycinamidine synthase subunit PurS [Methylacidiphilum caldifontis]QSR87935.1 phosphoribosylformylglycinamidine synthase subunit PurS [Methylacidiphilum caldifontis]TFE67626.1 phosphoribosylformylglycinamidine synthase, purS protein [Methylacidiphilum caldifontis]
MIRAKLLILPKTGVFDPQGEALRNALIQLGLNETQSVRVGKDIVIEFKDAEEEKLKEKVEEVAKNFLSNPVIEQYEIEWEKEQK